MARPPKKRAFAPQNAPRSHPRVDSKGPGKVAAGKKPAQPADRYWLYGRHAVQAALANPERQILRLWLTTAGAGRLGTLPPSLRPTMVEPDALTRLLGEEAVHQGIAAEVRPLEGAAIEDVLANAPDQAVILLLDQVTDPHNVGAILRTAAAFDVRAVILARDHAPDESATMAKTACGGLELVPLVYVANLSRAMAQIKDAGFWIVGLEGEASKALHEHHLRGKTALVLGAEGSGLRRLTHEGCDLLARLPISPRMESLNVSNAAAIALYELAGRGAA